MNSYPIVNIHNWQPLLNKKNNFGIHEKKWYRNLSNEEVLVKFLPYYNESNFSYSEIVAEKIAYELANILQIDCAKVDFIKKDNMLGIGSYNFIKDNDLYFSFVFLLTKYLCENTNKVETNKPITFDYLKMIVDEYNPYLYEQIIKILIFDALIGESDRHPNNWGLIISFIDNKPLVKLAPLFDNGSSLLFDWGKNGLYGGKKSFKDYILCQTSKIVDKSDWFNHFELIKYLFSIYPELVNKYINELSILNDKKINIIISKVPNEYMNQQYFNFLTSFIKKRRDILFNIILKKTR